MTVQEKLESLVFSETERALIRKWMNETPSPSRMRLRSRPKYEYALDLTVRKAEAAR